MYMIRCFQSRCKTDAGFGLVAPTPVKFNRRLTNSRLLADVSRDWLMAPLSSMQPRLYGDSVVLSLLYGDWYKAGSVVVSLLCLWLTVQWPHHSNNRHCASVLLPQRLPVTSSPAVVRWSNWYRQDSHHQQLPAPAAQRTVRNDSGTCTSIAVATLGVQWPL